MRLVDPNNIQNGKAAQLWLNHDFDNTDSFQRHTIDLTLQPVVPKNGLLELQAYNMLSRAILVSTIVVEIQ